VNNFTKPKFLTLPPERQHKQAAKLLKEIYRLLLEGKTDAGLAGHYQEMVRWAGWKAADFDLKSVSDRYHWHLQHAQCHLKEHNLLPAVKKGDKEEGAEPLPISIFLDNIRSAHNVGSIIRTTEAFALGSLYFSSKTAFTDNLQVQNAAMGAHQWVSCVQSDALENLPKPIILLETGSEAESLYHFPFPDRFTLVVGNEEYGCSEKSLQLADTILEIPMAGRKNSLNVANAYAIAASEIHRQRRSNRIQKGCPA
jgi:tRNA G18 (ribose-2'-O)-methylase SpoU